jgi:hypothetical protein
MKNLFIFLILFFSYIQCQNTYVSIAEQLIINLAISKQNVYGNPSNIVWNVLNFFLKKKGNSSSAYVDCSGFSNSLLKYTYSWSTTNLKNMWGSTNPSASKYHENIINQKYFQRITQISQIQRGDFIASIFFSLQSNLLSCRWLTNRTRYDSQITA